MKNTTEPIPPRQRGLGSWLLFVLMIALNIGAPLTTFILLPIQHAAEFLLGYAITGGVVRCYDMWRDR